ncbi:MAG: T9SS type A sorting domain-containing protein [Bacteroidota bacterium]|nr:T9SS type A sorting domain-containing protein [Bacteroidota bacterium]
MGQRVYKYSRKTVGINLSSTNIPSSFYLYQNYPNPFNPSSKIKFDITRDAKRETLASRSGQDVTLIVYDALGKETATLVNKNLSAGSYEVEFNGRDLSSGIYFYKLETGNFSEVKRMILLK